MTDDPTAGSEPNAEPEVESESGSESEFDCGFGSDSGAASESELESTGQPHHQSETDESATASQSRNDPVVVVVDSETSGNIGTIARAMKNFGLDDLRLVNPPDISRGTEAYGLAAHARDDVLANASEVTLSEIAENYHTVGCTAVTGEDSRRAVRFPFKTPRELAQSLERVDTQTAILFGREGNGLSNDELAQLDEVCAIPAADDYPTLNLGQAATVLLYELRHLTVDQYQIPDIERERASQQDIERFHEYYAELLAASGFEDHRRDRARTLVRRLVGRSHPTDHEVTILMGVLRQTNAQLRHRRELLDRYDEPDDLS
ncbi:MAG: RNA methyltransferase, TrmH family, group 1 [Halorubrum sp. J07HR59]|nr:MAG: RNA methyltransferase, TrmH family, group 1 [Halorubrum sp. J07HR59]